MSTYHCRMQDSTTTQIVRVPPVLTSKRDVLAYLTDRVHGPLAAYVCVDNPAADHTCQSCGGSGLICLGENVMDLCTCLKRIGMVRP